MLSFSLSVLALAAGVFLLLKVKQTYMGKLMETLSWLVIVLAVASMVAVGIRSTRCMNGCRPASCSMKPDAPCKMDGVCPHHPMKDGCHMMNDSASCNHSGMDSAGAMKGECPYMKGGRCQSL